MLRFPLLLVIALAFSCTRNAEKADENDSASNGDASIQVSGPSFSGVWDGLDARQLPGPGPDAKHTFELWFESPWDTPEDEGRVFASVSITSVGYDGPGQYPCGRNVLQSGEEYGELCTLSLRHYQDANTLPGLWIASPEEGGPHPNCFLIVEEDGSSGFRGRISCEQMYFPEGLNPEKYDTDDPDHDKTLDMTATWAFSTRVIFDVITH